ncbi:hypothetical protein LXM60_19980 [Pandoraea sputorum]|uniref:hypothetical protein n=1 Tax=Pandoraea sputorum TaxID=93222 RepID=UPI001E456342|nr:hypothetical protein [Pandoraea sputorum]MCE4062484.1 hypothetical protein [Pandoraea sputorum]
MTFDPALLPACGSEDAKREHADAASAYAERDVDMCAVDIVAITAENIGNLVLPIGVQPTEHADAELAELRPREAELGRARFVTSRQDQRDFFGQLRLNMLKDFQSSRIHTNVARRPSGANS